jgi:membrane associated rhomboid family serine protease
MNQYQQMQRPNPLDDLKKFFRKQDMLARLITINIGVWMLIQIAYVVFFFFNKSGYVDVLITYLSVPSEIQLLIQRPWTLVTYMFLHKDFFHILFNMLWLYWFGKIFLQYLNRKQLLLTYIVGGLVGAGLYILAYNTLPVFMDSPGIALGASASVMAVVTAISFYVPNYTIRMMFIGNIKIYYLAIALFVLDFFSIPNENAGGHIAHIGGAIFGVIFIYFLKQGTDFSKIFSIKITSKKKPTISRKRKKNKTETHDRPSTDDNYNRERANKQKMIDKILDKISQSGYDSLTKQEKELLFKSSNKK